MTVDNATSALLSSVEGEISFFRSIMHARPVGIHRHFHVLAIQNSMLKDTGRLISRDAIWDKLRSCYDMDALEAIDLEASGYESPHSIHSPSSANISTHPYFREEFSLPFDDSFEALISQRRLRATASPASTPAPSPVAASSKPRGGKKRGRTKLSLAGLVGGDSDSSALTQESGDEDDVGTPRRSVMTATDAGTDHGEDEDVEGHEPSQALSVSPKPTRNRGKTAKKPVGRPPRTTGAASTTRPTKKRKR